MKGKSHSDNSRLNGVSRQTIAKWAKDGGWQDKKDTLEQVTTDKYIERESDNLVRDVEEIDVSHKEIAQTIVTEFKKILNDRECSTPADREWLGWIIQNAPPVLALQRKITGLDKMAARPPKFAQAFAITLQTTAGPISFQPNRLTHDAAIDLLGILPNQNPEVYGEPLLMAPDEYDEDDQFYTVEDNGYDPQEAVTG